MYIGPVNRALVRAASLYQVNTGLVTVVLLAVKVTALPEHRLVGIPVMLISAAVAVGLTNLWMLCCAELLNTSRGEGKMQWLKRVRSRLSFPQLCG